MLCHRSLKMGIIMIIILLSGCQMAGGNKEGNSVRASEISGEELPDVRVFQDEFTRGFMKSPEEVEEGFYVFESGTGLYEMWLPGGTGISEKSYTLQAENQYERIRAGIKNENGTASELRIEFSTIFKIENIDNSLRVIDRGFDEDLNFEEAEFDGRDIYIAPLKYRVDEGYGATISYI